MKTFAGQTHAQQLQQAGIVVNQSKLAGLRAVIARGTPYWQGAAYRCLPVQPAARCLFRFVLRFSPFGGRAVLPADSPFASLRCCPGFPLAAACAKRAGARYRSGSPACARCPAAAIADAPALAQRIDLAVAALLQMLIACFLIEQRDLQQLLLAPQLRQRTQ